MLKVVSVVFTFLAYCGVVNQAQAVQPKKTTPSAAVGKTAYASTPFDLTADNLPPNYRGHDVLGIFSSASPPRPKGEFETSDEYAARIQQWRNKPYLARLTPSDTVAFEVLEGLSPDALKVRYDADNAKLSADLQFENRDVPDRARWLELLYTVKDIGTVQAQTMMGVKFRVTLRQASSVGVAIDTAIKDLTLTVPLERAEALRLRRRVSVFAIGKLVAPYTVRHEDSTRASLDEPVEWHNSYYGLHFELQALWLVDRVTGAVLLKQSAPFKECPYGVCS
jgi:hypothetical protein